MLTKKAEIALVLLLTGAGVLCVCSVAWFGFGISPHLALAAAAMSSFGYVVGRIWGD